MSFEFHLDTADGVQHLTLVGRLDSATFIALEKTINGLFNSAGDRVLIDFSALIYISSAGLRLILVAAKRARQVGGRLILCGLSPSVRDIFEISGFLKIMETADSKADAERALKA
jgi:anti-anti-sigma factor